MHPRREIRRFFHPMNYPWGAILMLHRIDNINPQRLWYNEHLKISPEFLDNLLCTFSKKGFGFISLDELTDIIAKKKRVRKLLAITLDDGYKDNFTNGLSLFKAHQVPFCIYVATRLPEQTMTYWWYLIEDIILKNDEITLSNGLSFSCSSKEEKENAFLGIRQELLKLPQSNLEDTITSLLPNYPLDFSKYNDTLPLSWEMLQQLINEPLAKIGCHTHSHISMSGCSRQMILDDIQLSLNLMKEKAGIQMQHFAYPFGDVVAVKDYHREIVQELDFKTIATTNEGLLFHNTDIHQLPRIFVTERNAYDILNNLYYAC